MSFFCTRVLAKTKNTAIAVAAIMLFPSPHPLLAASRTTGVGFQGLQSTVAIGLGIPHGVALDAAGNLYVTDLINSKVLKVSRRAASANCTVNGSCISIGSGFVQPVGVAVDAAGDVFVVDASTLTLYKIIPDGTQTVVASNLPGAFGVAVAADGTAYIACSGSVRKISSGGAVSIFANGPAQPGGIAVDVTGNVYLIDTTGNRVLRYTSTGAQSTLASGFNAPQAVALDGTGSLYVTDTGNNRILTLPTGGDGQVCPADCTVLAVNVDMPNGVASDASGNLYIADTGDSQVVRLAQDADFGTAPVVASSANPASSLTLNYLLYGSSCAALPTVSVLTRGAANKDFTSSPASSVCTSGTPDSLAVTVNFAPLSPGLRTGSVQFLDATGVVQAATYLHGVGKGPLITWTPGVVAAALTSSQ